METKKAEDALRPAMAALRKAQERGGQPFGAPLTDAAGTALMVAQNNRHGSTDCTGHAGMVPLRRGATVCASSAKNKD